MVWTAAEGEGEGGFELPELIFSPNTSTALWPVERYPLSYRNNDTQ